MQDNLILKAEKTFALSKPAIILLVLSVILTAILGVATVRNMDRSQRLMELSFLRQGTTMIQAFEAATRTSLLFRKSTGHNPLKDLTTEVLKDKGIAYIRIIDEDDTIIVSEGNVSQSILKKYSDLKNIGESPYFSISWPNNIFEVSQQFHPEETSVHDMSMMERYWAKWNLAFKPKGLMYISVGFHTHDYEETMQQDMYHTIFMLVMLILLFLAGLYFIFLYQRIRITHLTLLNTQLYTNNVLESIPDALLTLDQNNHIVSCNKNAEKILMRDSTNIVGENFLDIFPACPPETLHTQQKVVEKDAELQRQNGKTLPIKMAGAQLIDHQGKKIGKVLVMRDVGEIHSMEQQLEHSRRLAALGSMAAGIAHEVRNPLGTLRGLAHFFGSEEGASEACKKYSQFMISEVDRLNQLVTELLQFGSPQDIRFERVDIKTMVEKISTLLENEFADKNINFSQHYEEDIELYGDTDQLIQTLLNLLKNSIQATPVAGEVSLDICCDGKSCRMTITDSGTGMSKETKNKIFDPFYTTTSNGSGLGMAVSHRIIERHKGYFEIDSTLNVGTTIRIVLPRQEKKHD